MYNNYEERIELLNKQLVAEYKRANELQARIDKVIEYLKDNSMCPDDIEVWGQVETDIYKILKGE